MAEHRVQLLIPGLPSSRLRAALDFALDGADVESISGPAAIRPGRILFAIALDEAGSNPDAYRYIAHFRKHPGCLDGCIGAIIVDGVTECYTKSLAREFVLAANGAGCAFIGRPLVEGTGSLKNFLVQAQAARMDVHGAYQYAIKELFGRLCAPEKPHAERPRLLVLYASNRSSSNTYALYTMVKAHLAASMDVQEIMLRNGEVADCEGCTYTTCMHFSERGHCFYGGVIVQEVYPALLKSDALMLLCPNYNDAADANITAFINRMTALFRRTRFYEKPIFSIIVSGYSGGDILAAQLISALNMNKSFMLPPRFCLLETANDPGSIRHVDGIREKAAAYAAAIEAHLTDC